MTPPELKALDQNRDRMVSGIAYTLEGQVGVMLLLPNSIVETPGGDPVPGVVMLPGQARELAFALLLQSEQVLNGMLPPQQESKAGGGK